MTGTEFIKMLKEVNYEHDLEIKMSETSAKEMFYRVGLTNIHETPNSLLVSDAQDFDTFVQFFKSKKTYTTSGYLQTSIELHEAIHQQLKELGWLK
jgi:hypothetical protein